MAANKIPLLSFCGSTPDFCDAGCQAGYGGCGSVNRPSCGGGGSVSTRTIGYYESWANARTCQSVSPEDLNLNGFTHINFAFAFFDPQSFQIAPMDGNSASLYSRFTGLKNSNSGLQTWISVGGWSFTDPGPTRTAFSDMVSSSGNRQQFINSLIKFMDTYGFDGVDLDWEYPQADDRGGAPADKENYVTLVQELRNAIGSKYGISMTLPTSYWYLQHFDVEEIQKSLDWFNLMAYDLHGVWDADSKFVGPYIAPHTNITEIDLALDLLWRAGVSPDKVVMGEGWYGRSFTLKDPSCNTPNGVCEFTGGANPGPCSDASGILTLEEINNIISDNSLTPVWDKEAAVKWITWDSNQWVSYDDDDTFQQKRDFANSRCLGGLMVWAMDQVDQKADNGLAPAEGITTSTQQDAQQMSLNLQAGITCYTTECGGTCKKGTNAVAQMNGQPGQLSTNSRCDKNVYRTLCCDDGTFMGTCQWRGYRGLGLSCISGCADGETEVVKDTNYHDKSGDRTCTGGLQSYCCKGFKSAPMNGKEDQLKQDVVDGAKAAAEAAAENVALDLAAKAFCRVAVPALLAPLEALEDLIPIIGEILDIAEIAATPELINLCVKGVEKEGKAEFKVFGKEHTLSYLEPTEKPSLTRPPEKSHTPAKTSEDTCETPEKVRRAGEGDGCRKRKRRSKTVTTTTSVSDVPGRVQPIQCMAEKIQQPCLHYNSVIKHHPEMKSVTCPYSSQVSPDRPYVAKYNDEHNTAWTSKIPNAARCERDEWPPAKFISINDGYKNLQGHGVRPEIPEQQYIRLLDGGSNGAAGQLFRGCPKVAPSQLVDEVTSVEERGGGIDTVWVKVKAVFTRPVFTIDFPGITDPDGVDGLQINECQPVQQGVNHMGFALLNEDPFFLDHPDAAALTPLYDQSPNFRKRRGLGGLVPDQIAVVEANSSRKATDEELLHNFGLIKCHDGDCSQELAGLGIESAMTFESSRTQPADVKATITTRSARRADEQLSKLRNHGLPHGDIPQKTEAPEMALLMASLPK
ncbi:glycoside hydrolase family 18 protein [Xylona heveae TC161]|uniref:chitinase n=1 Tax=Xylona heveae (strain CBS 132557 / TC161) TaxID=1328760 RepID=A0A165HVU8_XYLHT|nr:glycoside hydrolase family 18 protein [Xylona heveae TC161]KZF23992.1 glycoside hydrolase family 18 protein [Xylona heveae TC161]